MNFKHVMSMLVIAVFSAAQAQAVPIPFSNPNPANIGANQTASSNFTLNAATQDLSTVSIQFDLGEVDEGVDIAINGTTIVSLPRMDTNSGGPVGITPGLNQPWNDDGTRPRAIFSITAGSVVLTGLINQNDATYSAITITAPITLPVFQDGVNTFDIKNNNVSGPGGSRNMALSGTVRLRSMAIPEPATISLGLLGIGGLMMRRRRAA
jgi:hypothetical protein